MTFAEFFLNDPALEQAGITRERVAGWSDSEQAQSDYDNGHFWEQGFKALLKTPLIGMIFSPERFHQGLLLTRDYLHSKGVTFGNEPGGLMNRQIQQAVNDVFSDPDMPFRWSFMVDGKTVCDL